MIKIVHICLETVVLFKIPVSWVWYSTVKSTLSIPLRQPLGNLMIVKKDSLHVGGPFTVTLGLHNSMSQINFAQNIKPFV